MTRHDEETGRRLPLRIAGTGWYVPATVKTSRELEAEHGIEPGWCERHLGIEQRRWATEETPSFMGAKAAAQAIEAAGIDPDEIDLIVSASGTANYEQGVPDGGPLIQKRLGLETSGIPSMTVHNDGMSFLSAIELAGTLIATGRYATILIVSSELVSLNLDTSNPHVLGRFADGAAAAVVTDAAGDGGSCIHDSVLRTYGSAAHALHSRMGFDAMRAGEEAPEELTLRMDAERFEELSRKYTGEIVHGLLARSGFPERSIRVVIPQQIGGGYLDHIRSLLPSSRMIRMVERFGFCGAASIPMALHHAVTEGLLSRGDRFLMAGAGAGMAVGAMILTY